MVKSALQDLYDFRDEIVGALRNDLLGPVDAEEIISDPPITRYITGILFPQQSGVIQASDDVGTGDGYDEAAIPDPGVALAHIRYPASMGVTFAVDPKVAPSIVVDAEAAMYEPVVVPDDEITETADGTAGGDAGARDRWRRRPLTIPSTTIDVTEPRDHRCALGEKLELFVRVRRSDEGGVVPVTVVLVNRRKAKPGLRDADAFFQPTITVTAPGGSAAFLPRTGSARALEDEELDSYRLLYRHTGNFAVGHGCSAEWEPVDASETATVIKSTFIPEYRLPLAESNPNLTIPSLSMKRIVEQDRVLTLGDFGRLADDYSAWIDQIDAEKDDLPASYQAAARRNVDECRNSLHRMRAGIQILEHDDTAWEAFRLANAAMLSQRARADWLRDSDPCGLPDEGQHHRWYPFQLAFILVCLPGIADPSSEGRDIADLLWFPTGGGKTEAYLGLIAFTILLRRLRNPNAGGGVTALMRYTLRLLTLQQYERAAILICALEHLRRDNATLGKTPITIGLWVGRAATPNTRAETRTALNKLRKGTELDESNPVQLHSCPWCGTRLDHENYWLPADKSRLIVSCKNSACEFGSMGAESLPVYLIDEDIYDYRPSLVIATADKFASLPWRERAGELFNINRPEPAPELIIQDELHLISGPLGTLTGLYETVVDHLCGLGGARPKVVASTATIRRASRQGEGLFARLVAQFPPSGIDSRDSFFAVEAPPTKRGTRSYVGLMAPGTSHTSLMVRTYAALLQTVGELDVADEARDAYWTLVGYFNSLRVLGGARMQVQDDVGERIELVAGEHQVGPRHIDQRIELTSRESSALIPAYLRQMGVSYPSDDAIDLILATNMISVGVDVGRLGLMAVMGQPPSTSEYIQATSRVGRQTPGLVAILYNASRSRDRSHYEGFSAYHASIYRQVESTSVTPFAPRARDRGLHAIIVALARHLHPVFAPNAGASAITANRDLLLPISDAILERVEAVDPSQRNAVAVEIQAFLDYWEERARREPGLVYSSPTNSDISLLGDPSLGQIGPTEPVGTLWSLRDVDPSSNLYLV